MDTPKLFALALILTGLGLACSTANDAAPTVENPGDPNPNGTPPGSTCLAPADCQSGVCTAGTCQAGTSTDQVRNGKETDVDCGGPDAPPCGGGKGCGAGTDCLSAVCTGGKCGGPGPTDGVKNGSETDVDCGGPGEDVPRCLAGKSCDAPVDCADKICLAGKCVAASPTDGVKNGNETDVDCGGNAAPKCAVQKDCKLAADCQSSVCKVGKCISPAADDGVQNGTETDVDCGGDDAGTPRCISGKKCKDSPDCASKVCDAGTKLCKAPSPTDGVQNGTETDVDCGGNAAPKCGTGLSCLAHLDCASNGCAYDNKCASHPSCTKLEGGYTCGPTDGNAKQSDCCASAAVGGFTVDKYLITAGRMRAFLDRFNGDIRAWAVGLPANVWNQVYTPELPQNYVDANEQLGPLYDKRACQSGDHTGHVFTVPPTAGDRQDFPKAVTDTKALNCVPWWLMSAFCVWDGGHLATEAEVQAAYTNNGATAYPWGARGLYTTSAQNDYAIGIFSYGTPNPPAAAHNDGSGYYDIAFYVAPPGRRPNGYNATGHADMVGNLLEWVSDRDRQFLWKGSWENHAAEADNMTPGANDPYLARTTGNQPWQWGFNIGTGRPGDGRGVGYYGIGGRCAR